MIHVTIYCLVSLGIWEEIPELWENCKSNFPNYRDSISNKEGSFLFWPFFIITVSFPILTYILYAVHHEKQIHTFFEMTKYHITLKFLTKPVTDPTTMYAKKLLTFYRWYSSLLLKITRIKFHLLSICSSCASLILTIWSTYIQDISSRTI